MEHIPRSLFDLSQVSRLDLAGRGGGEKRISLLLPGWRRVSRSLYDFEIATAGATYRLEVKKQADLQWFDSGKYYELSQSDREIGLLFLLHRKGPVDRVVLTSLGELVDWLCEHRAADGWNDVVMAPAARFKRDYPSLQFKARVYVRKALQEAPELFDELYP